MDGPWEVIPSINSRQSATEHHSARQRKKRSKTLTLAKANSILITHNNFECCCSEEFSGVGLYSTWVNEWSTLPRTKPGNSRENRVTKQPGRKTQTNA